ncbi:unnamed protein product [Diabrotica balteata]|uniref:Peptidase S1 domain-containing protein n=1 Tax=Diabrotica balteata TaxID=107213 RepID=A0A9N9X790_DIABA|nr:unnamed protein product [Diabrotica balteata]
MADYEKGLKCILQLWDELMSDEESDSVIIGDVYSSDTYFPILQASSDSEDENSDLEEEVKFSKKIRPIKLPEQDAKVPKGTSLIAVGWAKTTGDSGGPLELNGTLVGIVSFGENDCVESDEPSVYVNVAFFRTWIKNEAGV